MDQLETGDNMIKLIIGICDQYNLDPSIERNIINIKAFLGPLNGRVLYDKYKTLEDTNQAIIDLYGEKVKASKWSIADNNDAVHDSLLKIISIPGEDATNLSKEYKDTFKNKERLTNDSTGSILDLDMTKRIEMVKYLNYSSLMREEYIIADSRYQNTVNLDMTKIVFNLITNSKIRSDHGGLIIGNNIKDIVQIEVSPFTIPYKPVFVNFYNKITLSINEWISNSYEAYEGGQFHFIFDIEKVDNNLIYLRPVDSVYSFSKPMNYIDNFTLSFGAMLPKITFDPDRMYVTAFDYTSVYGIITFASEHNLVTGDLVYVSGFSTPDLARDVLIISEMNRDSGHIIVKKDNFSILLNVDLSQVRHEYPIGTGQYPIDTFIQDVLVYFASKRIKIPFRMKYLTNYVNS
jgi:hypothetical protein